MIRFNRFSRRDVVKGAAGLSAAAALAPYQAAAQVTPSALRRSIGSMAVNDPTLASYRAAIRAMQALPLSDNRNWRRQAEIHQNFCPHGNWYFLPWHRAYLVAFERICRELSGDANFALPYWDWTSARQLPAAFAAPLYDGQPNPLFDASRTIPANFSLPNDMVGPTVIAPLIAEPNFQIFGSGKPTGQNNIATSWQRAPGITGPLEGNPHNRVHGTIGGIMGGYLSPLDPIFWLHHCNVDRLWQERREAGRSDPTDPLWSGFSFTGNFWQADGSTPYNVAVSSLQDVATLGYRYRPSAASLGTALQTLVFANLAVPRSIQVADLEAGMRVNVSVSAQPNIVLNAPFTLSPGQAQALSPSSTQDGASSLETLLSPSATRVLAVIGDVVPPSAGNVDVRVFINCDYLAPETPTTDPSYCGTFTFFGAEHAGHGDIRPSYLIDLTDAVLSLRRAQKPVGGVINIQLMPAPIAGSPASEFRPGNIRLVII